MPDSSSDDVTLESSPSSEVVETASTTVTESEETSVLDAVEAALKPEGVEAGSPPAETGQNQPKAEPDGSEQAPAEDNGDISDEEKKQFSERAQERIRDLAAQKNELRTTVEDLQSQVETYKPKIEAFESLTGYLTENNISAQEANNALEITRLIKGQDYEQALGLIAPLYQELAKRTGGVLDEDLREDVRLGHIPLQRAQEIQKGRASEATNREREQSRTQREEQRQQTDAQKAHENHVRSAANAADEWAKAKAETDPDWNQKVDLVAAQVNVLVTKEGFPKTLADVTKLNERALEIVEGKLSSFRPKPQAIDPKRHTGTASPSAKPAPQTALEALEQGLAQA